MVLKEIISRTNLSQAKTLGNYELLKVIMIGKDEDHVFIAFKIMVHCLKNLNNS